MAVGAQLNAQFNQPGQRIMLGGAQHRSLGYFMNKPVYAAASGHRQAISIDARHGKHILQS